VTAADYQALLPLIIVAYGAVMVLVVGAFWRSHLAMAAMTLLILAAAFVAIFAALPCIPWQVTPLLRVDSMALFYIGLIILGAFAIAVFSYDYLAAIWTGSEKFYALLLLSALGMGVVASSSHFASFFAGLETFSVALYGLIGYTVRRPTSLEAGLKYLVLAGSSIAFLLFGMALIYFDFGTMEFGALAASLQDISFRISPLSLLGLGLILVGFAFKLAAVPFHTWAPDVYQGAPAPATALVATGSKAAVFALLIRFVSLMALPEQHSLFVVLEILAIITMVGGNLLALLQRNIKRLLACSAIAHIGYLLIPLIAGTPQGAASIGFYFASYFITTIGAFGVIGVLSTAAGDLENLDDYRGLGYRRPWLAGVLALMMLSLAGIPPTVGFIAKFYIFAAAAHAGLWALLIIGLVNSGIAVYYYLRVLATLYMRPADEKITYPRARPASAVALAVLAILLFALGIYPAPLVDLAGRASFEASPAAERPVIAGQQERAGPIPVSRPLPERRDVEPRDPELR
jgi:NADH-quinone oxidoreductase subunit N